MTAHLRVKSKDQIDAGTTGRRNREVARVSVMDSRVIAHHQNL